MKNLQNLKGAKELTRSEQKSIQGGGLTYCSSDADCALNCGKCLAFGVCIYRSTGCNEQ